MTAQSSKPRDDLSYWQGFVAQFFAERGVFRLNLFIYPNNEANAEEQGTSKQYEITQPALARYFHTHFTSGIRNMQLTFEKGTIDRPLPNNCHFIENPKASLIYWYDNSHVCHRNPRDHVVIYAANTPWTGRGEWELAGIV